MSGPRSPWYKSVISLGIGPYAIYRRRRIRDRAGRAALSVEQRQLSLQRRRDGRTAESPQQREVRLLELSTRQSERLASESTEEREARLGDLSARRRERAVTRFEQQRSHQTEREASAELVNHPSIQAKMRTFHAHFSALTSPTCSTCLESFPGLQLRPSSTECVRCLKDLRTPKLFSSANNMDPGTLPSQLQVSKFS